MSKIEYLSFKVIQERYPLLCKLLEGGRGVEMIALSHDPGYSGAHMIFAPQVERALEKLSKERLLDALTFKAKVLKKRKNK